MSGLTQIIADILIKDDKARDSDTYLYHAVCMYIAPVILTKPFGEVILNPKKYGIPGYDTVTRLRRKVQRDQDELKASEQVTQWRADKEEQVRAGIFI